MVAGVPELVCNRRSSVSHWWCHNSWSRSM